MPDLPEPDDQDQAEAFDETNFTDGGDLGGTRSFAEAADRGSTLEEISEVPDLTALMGDRDADEALAPDAADFDPDAVEDADLEADDELSPEAATAERQDDLDGLGAEDSFDEDALGEDDIEGLDQVRDAAAVEGGEDDVTDFESPGVRDADLGRLGYRGR